MKKTYNDPKAIICALSTSDVITLSGTDFFDSLSRDYVIYAPNWGMEME